MLGKGNLSFWEDVWVKDKPLSNFCPREEAPEFIWVKDLWRNLEWDEEALWTLLEEQGIPRDLVDDILLIPFYSEEEDKARWTLTPHGNFTLASAWEQIRERGVERVVYKIIWNKSINPTISVFLWRFLANRLPVDEKVQWRGVALASKCHCCVSPRTESRIHLFVNGEAARGVWTHFASWFPQATAFEWPGDNLEIRLRWWQVQAGDRSDLHINTIIPYLIMWYLWTERNGCVHHETKFRVENVCHRVKMHLCNLDLAGHIGPEQWRGCELGMTFMGGRPARGRIRRVERILWKPPDPPWLNLNSDEAFDSVRNKAGGGGLFRNCHGELVEAFSTPLNASSGLEAEMGALWEGIQMAKNLGTHVWLETDAEVLCSILEKGQLGPAETRHLLVNIRWALKGLTWRITHICREGNKAVDCLAALGKESPDLSGTRVG